jgi:hypothetical protein
MDKILKLDTWKPALGWLGLFILAQLLVNVITLIFIGVRYYTGIEISQSMMITLPMTILYLLFFLYLYKYKREAFRVTFHYAPMGTHTLKDTIFLPFIGMFLLIFPVNMVNDALQLEDVMEVQFDMLMHNPLGIMILAIIAPIIEEMVFRIGIQGSLLRKGVRPGVAIFISSAIFALVHMNPAQMPGAFMLGAFLGWIYYCTGTGLPCVFTHIFNNYFAIVCTLLLGEEITTTELLGGPVPAKIISVVCLLLFAVVVRYMKRTKEKTPYIEY